ncbi:uncharacterized protein B0I36DRAFT_343955 [Microdochium trichocladiopsis]|uniref:Uncharacterized protein n=1 Tax=Microdochium trichocladiopsis TaxID=1682393 RepID=A0A9P9BVW2_9PEZI|nr:uncharacterized protein B0I36DRAFT_343955 [Microdochium trichocladiopsis]KAH7040167.1 hypothetical protein B0I36DRAFT_343955 [Microdochium trichocladiopsis]
MFGSYGSYSSMSSSSQALDIAPTSYLSRTNSFTPSCAFPSWPQERASSYLSDDDLFPCESVIEETSSTTEFSPATSPQETSPFVTEEQMLLLRRQQQAVMQQEALQFIIAEKERRKQARKAAKRGPSYCKTTRSSSKC